MSKGTWRAEMCITRLPQSTGESATILKGGAFGLYSRGTSPVSATFDGGLVFYEGEYYPRGGYCVERYALNASLSGPAGLGQLSGILLYNGWRAPTGCQVSSSASFEGTMFLGPLPA